MKEQALTWMVMATGVLMTLMFAARFLTETADAGWLGLMLIGAWFALPYPLLAFIAAAIGRPLLSQVAIVIGLLVCVVWSALFIANWTRAGDEVNPILLAWKLAVVGGVLGVSLIGWLLSLRRPSEA